MAKTVSSPYFTTPIGVASFTAGLFKAKPAAAGAEPKYTCTAIFTDQDDKTKFQQAIMQVINDTWGSQGMELWKNGLIRSPMLKGDGAEARSKQTGAIWEGLGEGKWFIRCGSGVERPPAVRFRDPNIQATPAEVYSGCRARFTINAFSWDHPTGGKGVSFGLAMVQKVGDGPKLGGEQFDAEKWFDASAVEPDAETGKKPSPDDFFLR